MRLVLNSLFKDLNEKLTLVDSLKTLDQFKILALGKKSKLNEIIKNIVNLPSDEKKALFSNINDFKKELEYKIKNLEAEFHKKTLLEQLNTEKIDTSLPGTYIRKGTLHPISLVMQEIVEVFKPLGFITVSGPEVEHDYYCFEALNIPSDHPARDMQDTFYVYENIVLRTHTSPVQIRTMLENKPPLRILAPGKVYRADYDISHTPMFHQIEGLLVDNNVKFSDLKGILMYFAKKMFGNTTNIRLRPSFFPFTEPSAEMDLTCVICKGKGCRVCKNSGWLEILGCGMVHPKVFENTNYSNYTGFAFGMGLERIAMLKYSLNDLRTLFENDIRFLKQF